MNPFHRYQEHLLSGVEPSTALDKVWKELRKTRFKQSRADCWVEAIHRNGACTRNYISPLAFYLNIPGHNYPWGSHCTSYPRTVRSLKERESKQLSIIDIFNKGGVK